MPPESPAAGFEAAAEAPGLGDAVALGAAAAGEPDAPGEAVAAGETEGTAPDSGRLGGGGLAGWLFVIPCPRLFLSNSPGIEKRNATKKNTTAAPTVTLARTVWVPRGPNAVELAPPPNIADASDLPGCSKTNSIRMRQDKM